MKAQAVSLTDLAQVHQAGKGQRVGQSSLVMAAHPKLLELIRSVRDAPCFICSPEKTGRSSLALDYAQRSYRLDEVLWIEGTAESFLKALHSHTHLEHLERRITTGSSNAKLVVIDDLPYLKEHAASRLSDWIDRLIERGVEVIVISTPQDDCLADFQSDRLVINGERLVTLQRWERARRIEALECFFNAQIPQELIQLAALMLLMGRGIVDNLRELDYEIPAGSHSLLKQFCPFFEIDDETGYFNTFEFSALDFTQYLPALLLEAPRRKEDREASDLERCFERLTQLSIHLFERSEREQSQLLLELIGVLLGYDGKDEPLRKSSVGTSGKEVKGESRIDDLDPASDGNPLSQPTEVLTVRLFGDFEILKYGQKLNNQELHRRKVRELLAHLVLNMGRGVARDALMERLWSDKDYAHAKDNFYATWSRLNRALEDAARENTYISNHCGLCRIDTRTVLSDVLEFEQLSKFVLFEQGSVEQRIEAIYQLEQIYRGDLLSGCTLDSYVLAARLRYRSLLVDVMIAASKLFSQQGNDTNAVWFARKAYDTDSTREDVYRILMTMQDKAGQRTSALKTYFDCKRFLSDELGILPSQKTTALYQELILDRR
jgi:DNA-binding SARP family transcriptional activator